MTGFCYFIANSSAVASLIVRRSTEPRCPIADSHHRDARRNPDTRTCGSPCPRRSFLNRYSAMRRPGSLKPLRKKSPSGWCLDLSRSIASPCPAEASWPLSRRAEQLAPCRLCQRCAPDDRAPYFGARFEMDGAADIQDRSRLLLDGQPPGSLYAGCSGRWRTRADVPSADLSASGPEISQPAH